MARLKLAIVLAATLALTLLATSAYADGQGTISGKLANKTPGGGPVAGIEVTLRTFAHQADGGTATTKTDQSGAFTFGNLSTANTYAYALGAQYQGVDYASDILTFPDGQNAITSDLEVFETTNKADAIAVDRAHIILNVHPDTQTLEVTEILVVVNSGDRSFVPSEPAKGTLHVIIPPAAKNLQLEPNLADSSLSVGDGFTYAGPVTPGANQLMYGYELPYTAGSYDLQRSFDYPVQQISFLMPEGGPRATSQTMKPQESLQLTQQGPKYMHLLGENVAAGTAVIIHLDALPVPSPFSKLSELAPLATSGILALAIMVFVVVMLIRRRRRTRAEDVVGAADEARGDEDVYVDDDELVDEYAEDDEAAPVESTPKKR